MSFGKQHRSVSRRSLLKQLGLAPLAFHAAPFHGSTRLFTAGQPEALTADRALPFHDPRVLPHYPARSPLEDVLRLVAPGSDEYTTEKYAAQIGAVLTRWSAALQSGALDHLRGNVSSLVQTSSLRRAKQTMLRTSDAVTTAKLEYAQTKEAGPDYFLRNLAAWIGQEAKVIYVEFEIISLTLTTPSPLVVQTKVRYNLLTTSATTHRSQTVGSWAAEWLHAPAVQDEWQLKQLQSMPATLSSAKHPVFIDVSQQAFSDAPSFRKQLQQGTDYWRSVLDSACGIDIYGNNGIAAGDFNNDGFDDIYVSQPAGLPNRLYRNRGDGTFDDVTEQSGVGVLDNTSCALFADLRNSGLQDLLVVCGSGPLLFFNQGDGTFRKKSDAFQFARPPQGTFTHAAIADYDLDGHLDIYFCVYSYYLGLDQYHYPVPYFDARNGPPNFLMENQGDGAFVDKTAAAGLDVDNDRYSFACAWGHSSGGKSPDLYVVNDFGRNVLYKNNGDGTFTSASTAAHVEDVGAGMSACWADTTNDGRSDLYVADMWSAAGQRVSQQPNFHPSASDAVRNRYRLHAKGNALYKNAGDGTFQSAGNRAGVNAGRWAWCSDFWDFDHDGYADLYVTNGYITAPAVTGTSAPEQGDLGSFFWRQVVGKSPDDSTPSLAYERGWNALNELIRSDSSWSGHERNVMFANNRDGTFTEVSGTVGLDFLEDGRSFALGDFDGDGRLEVALKSRTAPQLRLLHNVMEPIGASVAVRLHGTTSNRDAIGTSVTLQAGTLQQTKYLQAGSGFLAQHSKELFFGLGTSQETISAIVRWPGGSMQRFENLPRNHRISLIEGVSTFAAQPFAAASAYGQPVANVSSSENDSSHLDEIATWLIDPLKAPAFMLPDSSGAQIELASLRGSYGLLHFWSAETPSTRSTLVHLQQHNAALTSAGVRVLAVHEDASEKSAQAKLLLRAEGISIPAVFATEEVTGIYNIVYRYLYDRRRNLPLPCSFLLDRRGMIVKVYQGKVEADALLHDVRSVPMTAEDRVRAALPFPGVVHGDGFSRNDFTYGVAMFQHGYLNQAAEAFQQVVAARPDHAEGYYNLGTLSLRRNDFTQARIYLHKALKLEPDYPEAWNNLGMMAAQEGAAEEAVRNFEQSLQLRPNYAVALLNLGNVYRRQGDVTRAKETLTQALALQPDDPEANYSLGMFYAQQGNVPDAQTYLQKAIALRPDYPEALNNLGVLLVRTQRYAEAEAQFKTCIQLSPSFDQSYVNLARLYLLQHQTADAHTALQELLRRKPESAVAKQALQMLESTQ